MVSIADTFKKVLVNTQHTIEQLANFIGMSVKCVMVHMQPKIAIKRVGQKRLGHCNNTMGGESNHVYKSRYVYNADFHDKQLVNVQYVNRLMLMCKFTNPNTLFSDVVKCGIVTT